MCTGAVPEGARDEASILLAISAMGPLAVRICLGQGHAAHRAGSQQIGCADLPSSVASSREATAQVGCASTRHFKAEDAYELTSLTAET